MMIPKLTFAAVLAAALIFSLPSAGSAGESAFKEQREKAAADMDKGMFKDAAEVFRKLALDPDNTPALAGRDLHNALTCLKKLDLHDEYEKLLEDVVEVWPGSWWVLWPAANGWIGINDRVQEVDGKYVRATGWTGVTKYASEHDRAIALSLLLRAEKDLNNPKDPASGKNRLNFYTVLADTLMKGRERSLWRLTALTDLENLPDYENYETFYSRDSERAPVDADGNPIFYQAPSSWEDAKNDGERWRWVLARMADTNGGEGRDKADWLLASFLQKQFDVHTIGQGFQVPNGSNEEGGTGAFAVRTLSENETIARLASGLKRFTLPGDANFIRIFRRLADGDGEYRDQANIRLGDIFQNRQQYPKAVLCLERVAKTYDEYKTVRETITRIVGNNGLLEGGPSVSAGQKPSIPYLFRNGKSVTLTAHKLDDARLLDDLRGRVKGAQAYGPGFQMLYPDYIGRYVVEFSSYEYIKEKAAEWRVDLEPLPDHYSRRVQLEMPVTEAGCYLVTANMENGNESRVLVWITDLAMVCRYLGNQYLFYVADPATGEPVPDATFSFLGWKTVDNEGCYSLAVAEFAELTDENGLLSIDADRIQSRDWLVTVQTADGRRTFYSPRSIYRGYPEEREEVGESAFFITDRPVYRPGQEINFRFWIGRPAYGETQPPEAGRLVTVVASNPRGEAVYKKQLRIDEHGGASDSITLDANALLGGYRLHVQGENGRELYGSLRIRLEEYKKPEYEVTVETPDKAIVLGDSAQIKIQAKYYYGSPVTDATVKYKVLRTPFDNAWYPPWRWDWLYGSGGWWTSYDYTWLPGWRNWGVSGPERNGGVRRVSPPWRQSRQPELVAEGEGALDADGVFRLPLDTASAKELFGGEDHEYKITVEVTDRSRRTIVGNGRVVAARKPFTATAWTDCGYYRTGQDATVFVKARLPLGGGVKATGKAVLHRIHYNADGTSSEAETQSWDVATDASGSASVKLKADRPGQYRMSFRLTDADGNEAEGASVLTVRGEGGEGDFRYDSLELVPDRNEYRPGDTVKLAVNARNKKAVVLFLPRAERFGGKGFGKPTLMRLDNGTATADVEVFRSDQPNFFCEAITVYDGKMHVESREIFVPPADKTLTVDVAADKESYQPGEKASFTVKVTGADGKPVAGECVVSVYDKSVEYISGGSNVPDIRKHFWSWKRHYFPGSATTLTRRGLRVERNGDAQWQPLGIFGAQEADWNDDMVYTNGAMPNDFAGRSPALYQVPVPSERTSGTGEIVHGLGSVPAKQATYAVAPMATPASVSWNGLDDVAPATGGAAGMAEAAVRSEFADTALWIAALETDENGKARFEVEMPENLTAWKAKTWTMASGVRVGEGESLVETRKNVIIRPQSPRFLTQKDQVVLSANLHNYLPRAKDARAELVLEGGILEAADGVALRKEVRLAANGEARVDWLVNARRPGEATVVMKLLTDEESDAAEIRIPVVVHGMRRVENFGGVIRGSENETAVKFTVPADRLPGESRLEFSFSPTIASSMLDALPFLVDYPYGCTEQTLNRFLPAVTARGYLKKMGYTLAMAEKTVAASADDPKSEEWRKRFGDPKSARNAVFDDARLEDMAKEGVRRLANMQCQDGGWGWFSGVGERSWPHTTAVVVHGLLKARDSGVAVPPAMLDRGLSWLASYRNRQMEELKLFVDTGESDSPKGKRYAGDLDAFINMILVSQDRFDPDMRDFLYRDRLQLSLSGLSMLGLALHDEKATNFLDTVLGNLEQYLEENAAIGTAWLRTPAHGWWWWYNDPVEVQTWYLKLLSRTAPDSARASAVAKHLLRNRKNGSYWQSTRDTAYAVEALAEYSVASGESSADQTVTVYLDGKQVMERRLTRENTLDNHRFRLDGLAVETGEHEIRIVRSGSGNLYYSGALDVFSLEDPIAGAGLELKVDRTFYKLVREEKSTDMRTSGGVATPGRVEKYRRERMAGPLDGEGADIALQPGDLVEVELTIEAANEYEYLVFEDMKAASLEAVELRSGYTVNRLGAYVEYRDQKVVLFVRHLPQGKYSLSYRFRAETPGSFSALPAFGGGMYATDLFTNSNEMKVKVTEAGVFE